MLISVGWLPPYWCPSRRLLRSRVEDRGLVTLSKIAPIPGPRLRRWLEIVVNVSVLRAARCASTSGSQRDGAGDRPGEGGHLSGDRHDDLVDVLPSGGQLPIPLAQAYLRLPADGLDLGRQLLQPELQMPADLRRIPIGPRAFDQRAPGVGVPGLGDTPLPPPLPRRVLRGLEAEVAHQLPRGVEPREVSQFGDQDDRARELDTPQRLDRLDHWVQAPAFHLLVQLALQELQSLVLFGDGAHVLLEDDLLRPGRTHHLGQPA